MNQLPAVGAKLLTALADALSRLEPRAADDIHINELGLPGVPDPEYVLALFFWLVENASDDLKGSVIMLLVPLQESATVDDALPRWPPTRSDLNQTPASFYVMPVSAFVQPDPSIRHIVPMPALTRNLLQISATYQCSRGVDSDESELWQRDIRLSYFHAPIHDHDGGTPAMGCQSVDRQDPKS